MESGSDRNDIFVDTTGRDTFDGMGGYDTVIYFMKSDPIRVTLSGSDNSTVYVGGVAEDTLRNIEDIIGGSGNDILNGDDKDNILLGSSGDDYLYGGDGPDQLLGADGLDFLDGGNGDDWALYKDQHVPVTVTLSEFGKSVAYVGGVAEDTLHSIEGLQGGTSHDTLTGNSADNTFEGREGRDFLRGNGGADHFIYDEATHGGDVIQDFNSYEKDQIDLDLLSNRQDDQDLSFTGTRASPFSVWYEVVESNDVMQRNDNTIVKADTDGNVRTAEFSIMLTGVTSLTADDFILNC